MPQVTFKRTSLGQFESFLDGAPTKWRICNGSLGMSGRGRNIYVVYDSTRSDGKPTKIQGTLQMCKKAVEYWLTHPTTNSKVSREKQSVAEVWTEGDFVYAAIRNGNAPAGTAHRLVGSTEYPVARVSPLDCNEYSIVRWMKRDERF